MPIELQNQEGLLSHFAKEKLDERVRAALEIGDVDDVDIGMSAREPTRRKDATPGVPEHVRVEIVDAFVVKGQKIEWENIDSVEITKLARDIAIAAAVIDVIGAADKQDGGLSRLFQSRASLVALGKNFRSERRLCSVSNLDCSIALLLSNSDSGRNNCPVAF